MFCYQTHHQPGSIETLQAPLNVTVSLDIPDSSEPFGAPAMLPAHDRSFARHYTNHSCSQSKVQSQ